MPLSNGIWMSATIRSGFKPFRRRDQFPSVPGCAHDFKFRLQQKDAGHR